MSEVTSTVVIVDNEPGEIAVMRKMLEAHAYRFETAATGTEAKALLRGLGPATTVVMMDWSLPDVDGLALLAWIQGQFFANAIEVIIHSDQFVKEDVEQAIDRGAYYFLTKPIDEPRLEAIVRAAVDCVELKRTLEQRAIETRDTVRLLEGGVFRFHTREEAELLAVHLASACGQENLSLALRELLVNAVEHGNLGITYEEKGRLLENGLFEEEYRRRLGQPQYRRRRVEVILDRQSQAISITVKDEGDGFDFKKYQTLDPARLFDLHGRGVLVASAALELEYTPPGNQVTIRLPRVDP